MSSFFYSLSMTSNPSMPLHLWLPEAHAAHTGDAFGGHWIILVCFETLELDYVFLFSFS